MEWRIRIPGSLKNVLDRTLGVVEIAAQADNQSALNGDRGHLKPLDFARSFGWINDSNPDTRLAAESSKRRRACVARSCGQNEQGFIDATFFQAFLQELSEKAEREIFERACLAVKQFEQKKRMIPKRTSCLEGHNFWHIELRSVTRSILGSICVLDEGTELVF
jgi:hypothetical protein